MNSFVRECQDYADVVKNKIRKIEKLFREQVCVFDIRKRNQSVYPIYWCPIKTYGIFSTCTFVGQPM